MATEIRQLNPFSNSIKYLAVKRQNMVTVTTRFMSRKLFMFFEVFIPSFVYDVIDMFCLPNKKVRDTYNQKKN